MLVSYIELNFRLVSNSYLINLERELVSGYIFGVSFAVVGSCLVDFFICLWLGFYG